MSKSAFERYWGGPDDDRIQKRIGDIVDSVLREALEVKITLTEAFDKLSKIKRTIDETGYGYDMPAIDAMEVLKSAIQDCQFDEKQIAKLKRNVTEWVLKQEEEKDYE